MKTQGVVIADDPVFVNWLQNGVGSAAEFSLIRASDPEDLMERLDNVGRIDIACFEFSAANMAARTRLVESFVERYPDVPVVGLGGDSAQDVVLAAMRGGARDFFVLQRDDEHLPSLVSKVLRRSLGGPKPSAATQGRVMTLFAAASDSGLAFAAEHLALTLLTRRSEGERGLLLDLSTPTGAGAVFLNLHPSYSLLDAVADVYRCDQTLIDTAFARHGSGLYVLTLPEDCIGFPAFEVDEFLKLIDVLRTLFSYIVIAVDAHAPMQALAGTVGMADQSLLLTDQSILRSRHGKYLLRELRQQDALLNHTRLVIDNYQRRLGLEADNLAQLLELPLAGTLSGQPFNRAQAMNAGEPLTTVAPRDTYIREMQELADLLWGGTSTEGREHRGSLVSRLLGRT